MSPGSDPQGQRLQEYCKAIWGDQDYYEFDMQTDDHETYDIWIEIVEDGRMRPVTGMLGIRGQQAAWDKLERELRKCAMDAASRRRPLASATNPGDAGRH